MKHRHPYGAVALSSVCLLFLLVSGIWAQQVVNPVRSGVVQDWSQHHVVFSRNGLQSHPQLLVTEPRIIHHALQRWQSPQRDLNVPASNFTSTEPQRDWNVALGTGRLAPNMFPAKYSFDPAAPADCVNDYVVFGLNVAGSNTGLPGGQANLVAFNNLYSGPGGLCAPAPSVLFAYNITTINTGRILTSPVLSADGKKIAFVESGSGTSIFHVITWSSGAGNGAITNAAKPGNGNAASMTSLTYAAALDTRSSPWVDYNSDVAYVGADDGRIYKITGVFKGTPTLAGAPWPVTISANIRPTAPVLDKNLGLLMVGSQNGVFYSIDTVTGAVKSLVVGRSGATNPGILAPAIVDVTNGTSFVVSANDGTSGVLVEVNTATMTQITKARLGLASKSGTAVSLFQPAFSNDYFNDPSTGIARMCGTGAADITPYQYAFGFTGTTLNSTPLAGYPKQLLTSTAARCTGWTEFFNPNMGAAPGTDFFFFGLTADCTGAGTSGCVKERTNNDANPMASFNVTGGPSGVVIDNFSIVGQASSIYFTGARAPNTAYKLTQNGLF